MVVTSQFLDESPHPHTPLEWWFFQGAYQGPQLPPTHFMVSLFRQQVSRRPLRQGFTALVSLLPEGAEQAACLSLVSPDVVGHMASLASQDLRPALDRELLLASQRLLRREGPPPPLRLCQEPARLAPEGLDLAWADIALRQDSQGIKLDFPAPGKGQACSLRLTPLRPSLEIKVHPKAQRVLGQMPYRCYPRLSLTGTVGGWSVNGQAWFDHQWGGTSWLVREGRGRTILGWDWLGVNLEDGSDLIVGLHRDMARRRLMARHATLRRPGGDILLSNEFQATPVSFWTSPQSRVTYPLAWRLEFPAWDLQLRVEALCPQQELPILGAARTVWEGAAQARGKLGGRDLAGRARLELYGYGFVFDLSSLFKRVVKGTERHLDKFLPRGYGAAGSPSPALADWRYSRQDYEETLGRPAWDLLDRGGKRWRPLLGMLLLEAMGQSSQPYEKLVAALSELPHSGALIIDDIQDNSLLRRGQPCLHLKYGQATAINVANALYFLPFTLLARHDAVSEAQRSAIYEIITRRFVEAHFGQGMDIILGQRLRAGQIKTSQADQTARQVLKVYAQKTGALPAGLAEVSCVIAQATPELRQDCVRFTSSLGVAFQIMDDVLNFCPQAGWSKTCGEDLIEGKASYVILRALASLSRQKASRLMGILRDPSLVSDPDALEAALDLVRDSGVLEACRQKAWRLYRQGWAGLSGHLPPSEAKVLLGLLGPRLLRKLDPAGSPVS